MNSINLELYRIFLLVAESGSFSAAAKKLFITQPAVSQAIKQLEECLGISLFIRLRRGVMLTQEGESILPSVRNAIILLEEIEKKYAV